MVPLESYLGFDIDYKPDEQSCEINMEPFIERVYKRFKMVPKTSVRTPLPENFQATLAAAIESEEEIDPQYLEDFLYIEKIGCILYLMICMRPDICFAVGLLARFSNKPTRVACAGVTQLLHYCYNTKAFTMKLGGPHIVLIGYSDADHAGDRVERRSTSSWDMDPSSGPPS